MSDDACCRECRRQPPITERAAAVFDYMGPAATFVKQMKYGGLSYLAQGGGAYMAMQMIKLDWPLPDLIIPMPMPSLKRLERGYNQSALLAESLGKLIGRPVKDIIKRSNGDYSQAGLNHQQRLMLKNDRFKLIKKEIKLYDQNILLVDDVMTTGRSLYCCAEALSAAYPAKIYALTLCRAI
jgi:competence protein ComFC